MSHTESESKIPESTGNELTFVRPLPMGQRPQESDHPTTYRRATDFVSNSSESSIRTRLFPADPNEDSSSLPEVTGLQLGHFVIEERIGRGGMGAVYRAIDKRLDRVVALKILSPHLSANADAIHRFQNEARAAAKLDHDNIARVHYIGEEHGLHFIAFEFVTGTNVRNFILQKGRISPSDVVNYTLQIAEALRHTSAANVVHRDIKPSNIIISPTGRAKLVDLGLARHQPADGADDLTVAGTALGTFDYIAPEQAIDARNVDVRSDIYSLGCTMYHMLTGEPPYPSGTMFQKVVQHHGPQPPNPSLKNPQIPPQLSRVVQRMMAANPDERYPNADSVVSDLVQIAENFGLRPTSPDAVIWTMPLFKARSPYWEGTMTWMAVALVLLLMVFLVDRIQVNANSRDLPITQSEQSKPADDASSTSTETGISQTEAISQADTVNTGIPEVETSTATNLPDAIASVGSLAKLGDRPSRLLDDSQFWNPPVVGPTTEPTSIARTNEEPALSSAKTSEPVNATPDVAITNTPAVGLAQPFLLKKPGAEAIPLGTLAAAFKLAENNSVIEVHTNGAVNLQLESIRFQDKLVRLRAAVGVRPSLRIDLREALAREPFASQASAFEIGYGGSLEVYGIDMELVVDDTSAVDSWSFFRMAPGASLATRWSTFTLSNRRLQPAAFVDLPESDAAETSRLMPERMTGRLTRIDVRESFVRGQMDAISQTGLRTLDARFDETAICVTGAVYRVDGSEAINMSVEPESEVSTRLVLNHVTGILGGGLLYATCGDRGDFSLVELDVRNSIIRLEKPGVPGIWLHGHLDVTRLIEKLQWQDHADPNYLIGDNPVCLVDSFEGPLYEPIEISQSEIGANLTRITSPLLVMAAPQSESTVHLVQPRDLRLFAAQGSFNIAAKAASDGRDLGVEWSRSQLPAEIPSATSLTNPGP